MAKIYERLLSTNILREKRRHLFDPQRVTLLGKDSICMVKLLEAPQMMVFFVFQAEDGIRDYYASRGLGDVYKRQRKSLPY